MKTWLSTLVLVMAFTSGCRKAVFQNIEEPRANSTSDSTGKGDGSGEGEGQPNTKTLIVSVPVAELPFGGSSTKATAKLKTGVDEPVTWTALDPQGKPIGTIDSSGTFTTPAKGDPTTVRIIAVSKNDPKLTDDVPLKLVPQSTKPELIVSVPVPQIKIGSNTVTAVAELKDGTKNPPVKWSVTGPGMKDFGKIDEKSGVYTSPATGKEQFVVMITANLLADPTVSASTTLTVVPVDPASTELIVTVPSPEIKSGGKEMQATAKLKDGTLNPPVKWSISGPAGKNAGSINDKGVYKSPPTASENIPVIITATLIANEAIKGSVAITVLKDDQIFARCTKANQVFPIKADVYKLPADSQSLPTNWKAQSYQTTVCLDQYNVPEREFTAGFPDLPGLFEDFGMTTITTIKIPVEGNYLFRLESDDGSKLWIDDTLVINHDGAHQTTLHDGTIYLKAGNHKLVLDYFQGPRYKIALMLSWQKPGGSPITIVPREAFVTQ